MTVTSSSWTLFTPVSLAKQNFIKQGESISYRVTIERITEGQGRQLPAAKRYVAGAKGGEGSIGHPRRELRIALLDLIVSQRRQPAKAWEALERDDPRRDQLAHEASAQSHAD